MKRIFSVLLCLWLFSFLSVPASALSVSAKGAVLINGTTGEILWQQNGNERLSMASTTKIMTALLLCETGDLSKTLVTTKEMVTVEGSSMGLLEGDTVSYRDLLYGMLLASGNDAANTTAIAVGGSIEDFVCMMNEKALEIGLKNTNFVTPSGLDSAEHYSTAFDMAMLARYALKNEDFRAACGSMYATLCYGNPPYNRTLKNHNKLLSSYDGLIGVKTGYTKKSGRCLVTAAERGSSYLIAVTLSAPNDWSDHKNMLDYGFSVLKEQTLTTDLPPLRVVGSTVQNVATATDSVTLALTDSEWGKIEKRVLMPRFAYASLSAGDTVGRVEYILNGNTVAASTIVVTQSAPAAGNEKTIIIILNKLKMLLKAMI